jgi:hypothetical protein
VNGRVRSDMVQTSDFRGREVLSVIAIFRQLTKLLLKIAPLPFVRSDIAAGVTRIAALIGP